MMNNGLERAQVEVDGAVDLGVVVVGVELPLAGELLEGGEAGRLGRSGPGAGAR